MKIIWIFCLIVCVACSCSTNPKLKTTESTIWTEDVLNQIIDDAKEYVKSTSGIDKKSKYIEIFSQSDAVTSYHAMIGLVDGDYTCSVQTEIAIMEAFLEVYPELYSLVVDKLYQSKLWLKRNNSSSHNPIDPMLHDTISQ